MDFSVFGIPVQLSPATLFIIVLFLMNGASYIKSVYQGEESWKYVVAGLVVSLMVFGSVVIHEVSHGLTATYFGIPIVEAGSTWWGAYVVPGVNPANISPLAEIMIPLFGPIANFVLGLIGAIFVFANQDSLGEGMIQFLTRVNFRLGFINLIPFFGLDGSKVLLGLLKILGLDGSFLFWFAFAVPIVITIYFADRAVARWVEEVP